MNLVVGGFQDFVLLSFSVGRGRVGGLERITTGFVVGDGLEMTNAWLPFVTLLFQTSGVTATYQEVFEDGLSWFWLFVYCKCLLVPVEHCVKNLMIFFGS